MKSSTVILALAASANGAVVARDASTVLADISAINTQTQSLSTSVNAFNDIKDATGLISAESALEDAINTGITDARATTGITDSEASSVLDAVRGLIPNIVTSLNAVVAKADAFTSAGVASVVTGDLQSLKGLSGRFADALIANAPEGAKAGGAAASSCINAAFSAALATQSVDGGCAAAVTFAGGPSPTTAPSANSTPSVVPHSSKEALPSSKEALPSAAPTGGSAVPYPTAATSFTPAVVPTGSAYPSYTPLLTNNAQGVRVGLTGVVALAILAMVL